MGKLNHIRQRSRRAVSGAVRLNKRITELEREVQESRRLNLRVAELCDVVGELLLPVADRNDEEIAAALQRYRADLSEVASERRDQ